MPELRQDPTTKEWIIISTERSKRPHEFRGFDSLPSLPDHDSSCPFCPGQETETPAEVAVYRSEQASGEASWGVRVIPNKFPALVPEGTTERQVESGFFWKMSGVGYHEVIIETPLHNRFIPAMTVGEVQQILVAYKDRFLALKQDRRIRYILIFKNHGEAAGTSLAHPHSQLVATSVVPANLRRKYEEANHYYDATGRCVFCDAVESELKVRDRVILDTDAFVVFHPFASQTPFETWIVPKRYCPTFAAISSGELTQLAEILKDVLGRLGKALNNPAYNYVINSAPTQDEDEDYYLWHIQILPRLTNIAGFELGSGMRINMSNPEDTARFIRETEP